MFMLKTPGQFVNAFLYLSRNIGVVYDCLAAERTIAQYLGAGKTLAPFIKNHVPIVEDILNKGHKVLVEGAQGALLDPDYGTYPFVTSSSTTAAGALAGAGIGLRGIDRVIGVVKAYTTRIGTGPFPTELTNEQGIYLREAGKEYGSTTGRPRRCGWLDIPALKYAAALNGLTEIALTKIDILSGLEGLKVCTYYENGDSFCDAHDMYSLFPHYVDMPSFRLNGEIENWGSLPDSAKSYVNLLQEGVGVRVSMISYGPHGRDTLVV
jgi:adenylosuccinate synthase